MKKRLYILLLILILALSGCEKPEVIIEDPPVIDTEAPIISLIGEEEIYLEINSSYIDEGTIVLDNVDTDLNAVVTGEVDTSTLGTYSLSYNVLDASSNQAETVTRTVYVINKVPGIIASFSYHSYDLVGFVVQVFDFNELLVSLKAVLYEDDIAIREYLINDAMDSFEFSGLETGIDYKFVIEGTYNMGGDLGTQAFTKNPIYVGTYRRIDESFREKIGNDELYDAIKDLIYLPYDCSDDVKLDNALMELVKIDSELVIGVSNYTNDRVIFVNGPITNVYEYFSLRGVDALTGTTYDEVSGVCCEPMVVRYDSGRVPEQVLMHEFGHSVDFLLLGGLSNQFEFVEIWYSEKPLIFPDDDYFDYPVEYFAECFAYYYEGEYTRQELLEKAPLTYAYMASLVDIFEELYN